MACYAKIRHKSVHTILLNSDKVQKQETNNICC